MGKTVINRKDYDLYRISFPWKNIFLRQKNTLIEELEKLHPRFSASCCYEARYRLRQKKLMAEVVVIEKSRLAKYKAQGGRLYLDSAVRRRVFSEKKIFRSGIMILLLLTALFLSARIIHIFPLDNSDEKITRFQEIMAAEARGTGANTENDENTANLFEEVEPMLVNESLIPEIFLSVSRHGGKISDFKYRSGDKRENKEKGISQPGKCSFSIYGCDCEDVVSAQYCVVSFKDNKPFFELELPFEENRPEENIPEMPGDKDLDGMTSGEEGRFSDLKNTLLSLGAKLSLYQNDQDRAEISFFADSTILYSCLKSCWQCTSESGWHEDLLNVHQSGGICSVNLVLDKNNRPALYSPLFTAAEYAFLFASDLIKLERKTVKKSLSKTGPLVKSISQRIRIGEIRKSDGSVIVCYRNQNGKMFFEAKEAVNEN